MNLYEIPAAFRTALNSLEVDEETGEIMNPEVINSFEMDAKEKIESAALFCREMDLEAKCVKEEASRLAERAKSIENRVSKIKDLILEALQPFDGKIKTGRITVYERRTQSVLIDQGVNLPEAFMTVKTTITPNKTALKQALLGGAEIEGVRLTESRSVSMR